MSAKHDWLQEEITRVLMLEGPLSLTEIRDELTGFEHVRPARATIKRHIKELIELERLCGAGRDRWNAQTYEVTENGEKWFKELP